MTNYSDYLKEVSRSIKAQEGDACLKRFEINEKVSCEISNYYNAYLDVHVFLNGDEICDALFERKKMPRTEKGLGKLCREMLVNYVDENKDVINVYNYLKE